MLVMRNWRIVRHVHSKWLYDRSCITVFQQEVWLIKYLEGVNRCPFPYREKQNGWN